MSNSVNVLKAYADQLALGIWNAKQAGPKPTAEMITTYHRLGARHGLQCLAGAMALRPDGVTGSEIVMACGNPQLNKMRGFVADALVKQVNMPKRNGHQVYKLELTAKGKARIERTAKLEAEKLAAGEVKPADKPAKVSKPRKAKAASVTTPEVVATTSHTGGPHDMGADHPTA